MTLSKAELGNRQIKAEGKRLQAATDDAYRSLIHLFLTAEQFANTCETVAIEQGYVIRNEGFKQSCNGAAWWPGHCRVESVLHHVLEEHRVIGHSAWSRVELPLPDRRIPAPKGTDHFLR